MVHKEKNIGFLSTYKYYKKFYQSGTLHQKMINTMHYKYNIGITMDKETSLPSVSIDPAKLAIKTFIFVTIINLFTGICDVLFSVLPKVFKLKWAYKLGRSFNITREDSLSNWFASSLTLSVALVLLAIAFATYRNSKDKITYKLWGAVSAFYLFMAFDDATKFHERLGSTLKPINKMILGGDVPTYNWQIIVMPIFVLIGLLMFIFLYSEFKTKKLRLTLFAALSCMAIAILMDLIEGWASKNNSTYYFSHFMKLFEEMLEMLGMTTFLSLFLYYLLSIIPGIKITVNKDSK